MVQDSFYFDAADQTLYVKMSGEPAWFSIEAAVRGFVLTAENIHDVVIRGLEFRHNRQPGGQWPMISISQSQRVVVEEGRHARRSRLLQLPDGQVADLRRRRRDPRARCVTHFRRHATA